MMNFRFPEDLQQLREVKDINDLQLKLNTLGKEADINLKYKFVVRKGKYLYACCSSCQSHLRYRLSESLQLFQLTGVQPFHEHNLARIKYDPIEQFIKNLPPMAAKRQVKALIMSKFQISSSQFYYLYNKIIQPRKSLQQYLNELNEEGCYIHYEPFHHTTQKPELMIIVTPIMKEFYAKYGRSISIDYTFNLFKQISTSGKTYKAGFIIGMSFSRRLVPFAILLAVDESKQTYYRSIKSFGQIVGALPNIIVTDQTLGATHGIRQLVSQRQFDGIHGLDTHHILKNIYVKLARKDNIKYFGDLIRAEDKNKFELILQDAYDAMQEDQLRLLERFVKNSQYYCLSQMPNIFIGRIPTTNPNEKSHDMLKSCIPLAKSLPVVIRNMIKLANYLLSRCQNFQIQKIQIQKYFGFGELRVVRLELDQKLFQIFCHQLSKSLKTELVTEDEDKIVIYDFEDNCRYFLDQGPFEERRLHLCSCKYQIKIGIPCRHQLRYLLVRGSRCLDYISQYWKISNKLTVLTSRRMSTGKKTRRRS